MSSNAFWRLIGPANLFLTVAELCAYLQTHPKAVRQLIRQGRLPPGIREGPRSPLRWRAEDIAAYLWLESRGARPCDSDGMEEDS